MISSEGNIVISNTTPIISLIKAEKLNLLKDLFGKVVITETVYRELTFQKDLRHETDQIDNSDFIIVAEDSSFLKHIKHVMEGYGLDKGEASVIAFSKEVHPDIVLMDEHKGRRVACDLGFEVMGTIGVLNIAAKEQLIDYNMVVEAVRKLKENNIRIKDGLCDDLINKVKKYEQCRDKGVSR